MIFSPMQTSGRSNILKEGGVQPCPPCGGRHSTAPDAPLSPCSNHLRAFISRPHFVPPSLHPAAISLLLSSDPSSFPSNLPPQLPIRYISASSTLSSTPPLSLRLFCSVLLLFISRSLPCAFTLWWFQNMLNTAATTPFPPRPETKIYKR